MTIVENTYRVFSPFYANQKCYIGNKKSHTQVYQQFASVTVKMPVNILQKTRTYYRRAHNILYLTNI